MADTIVGDRGLDEVVVERPSALSWGAIFGGTFAAVGIWILLASFGLAVGLSAVDPREGHLRGVGIWLGVWSLISPILALFAGSWLGGRTANVLRPLSGIAHGVVIWGLTTLLGTLLLFGAVGAVARTTANVTGQVLGVTGQAAASVIGSAQGGQVANAAANFLNINSNDLLAPVNARLRASGKPPVTAEELKAAMQDAANTALRQGSVNQDLFVTALARHTRLGRQDAQALAAQLQQQWQNTVGNIGSQLQQVGQSAQMTALSALDMTGKTFWWIFGANLLGLLAAVGAGWLAVQQIRRAVGEPAPRLERAPVRP